MSDASGFIRSASAAVEFFESLLNVCGYQARRDAVPSLMDMLTVCRESGSRLPQLESYAKAREHLPGMILCGGNAEFARDVAYSLGYELVLPETPKAPVIYSAAPAAVPGITIRYGATVKEISLRLLIQLIESQPAVDDVILVQEHARGSATWRFLWIPHPEAIEPLLASNVLLEVLLGQDAAMVVMEETQDGLFGMIKDMGQILWVCSQAQAADHDQRLNLLAGLEALGEQAAEHEDERAAAKWGWLSERLITSIEQQQRDCTLQAERLETRMKSTRHLLEQYHTSWTGGMHNLVDSYLSNRTNSPAFAALLDPQKPGPVSSSFMSAIAVSGLKTKIESFVTDRMAEFVAGLSAFAVKLELRQIALNEINTTWKSDNLTVRLEKLLDEKSVFAEGGGKRGGIVGAFTGKAQAIIGERKAQISKATRFMAALIEADFHDWCKTFMAAVERQVRLQTAAALVNKGLPDAEHLRAAADGLNRVGAMVRGEGDGNAHNSETVAAEWLTMLTRRRWIPLYHSS